jgi:cytochrome c oxidase subunit III
MISDIVSIRQKQKIHPHKFTLWIAIGSIIMMFAGLTSAYIVKSNQASWQEVKTPQVFWYSTAAILLSSLTIQMALRSFKQREMNRYRQLMAVTTTLGIIFIALQWNGFMQLWNSGVEFKGVAGAGQFLYVIFGLHALHVLGGAIALLVMFIKAFFGQTKTYGSIGIEVMSTYWHFVDILWIYLFVFFIWIK